MGTIYVVHNEWIKDPETGDMPYKIGITKNKVESRFHGLGLKMPGEFECDFAYEFDDEKLHAKLEKRIHGLLDLQRLNGEWFICNDTVLNTIEEFCKDFKGKQIIEETENDNPDEIEEEDSDNIFLQAQERIEIMISILTKEHNVQFYRRSNNKLNVVRIENKFNARLECNIYHPYNRRVDLEFICRSSHKFPEIKNFIKELDGSNINGNIFKTSCPSYKIYHIFNYEDSTILETFLKLLDFISDKMKNSQLFNLENS